ncbi:hypothetical protein LNKW23_22970 [Paralimibaculum aggregatum]|uniref:Sulfatase-modifying factor enzyme-like domain-containing protein n=1 Tax=Paralimibaculum aggregatum TaxID=3036245 RepID=A0ABQ6LQD9_9RHOB|nr:SUMF1/EgtB/PvdO family nonheme iron enzyme [Limibaculum sp. NKW23]GMG83084.1 hypothetical protein LNKW23_22970 [Limibaculum sp. NKW23]
MLFARFWSTLSNFPAVFAAILMLVSLAGPAAAQYVRPYDDALDDIARDIAQALSAQTGRGAEDLKFSLIRQARSSEELLCQPFSGRLARGLNDKLTSYLRGFRMDRIDSQRRESLEDGAAIAVKWSVEDADTVLLRAEVIRFSDSKILASAPAYVAMDTIPASDRVCLASVSLVATCTAREPVALMDSPVPEKANFLETIEPGESFRVLGAFNLPAEDTALALLIAYAKRNDQETAEEQRRAFALGGTGQLRDWAGSGVCSVAFWGPYAPRTARQARAWEPYLPVPEQCADCPPMMVLPKARFALAAAAGARAGPERLMGEGVESEVEGLLLAVGITEVTVAQWRPCELARACAPLADTETADLADGQMPVSVSWEQAQAYIRWLNSVSNGPVYRLPSEAEWEYAARGEAGYRAGATRPPAYWWGDVMLPGRAVCQGCAAPGGARGDGPMPVGFGGERESPRWRLQDMSGNLWEWVEDCWSEPDHPVRRAGCPSRKRVVKGGSYADGPLALRIENRAPAPESLPHPAIGFRVVASEPVLE